MAELLYPYTGHKPDAEVIQWARDFLTDEGDTELLEDFDLLREDEVLGLAKKVLSDAGHATFAKEGIEP